MRTTVNIDIDVIEAARSLARQENSSLGAAISKLARRGFSADAEKGASAQDSDLPVFSVAENTPRFGSDDVRRALEED